jgi:hypothetical protein
MFVCLFPNQQPSPHSSKTHTYIHIHVNIHTHIYIYMYTYSCKHTYIYAHVCAAIFMCPASCRACAAAALQPAGGRSAFHQWPMGNGGRHHARPDSRCTAAAHGQYSGASRGRRREGAERIWLCLYILLSLMARPCCLPAHIHTRLFMCHPCCYSCVTCVIHAVTHVVRVSSMLWLQVHPTGFIDPADEGAGTKVCNAAHHHTLWTNPSELHCLWLW